MLKKLAGLWTLLRTDLRATVRAWRHPATPFWFKAGVVALIVYFFSPIDFLPEALFGPIGLLDDVVLLPMGLAFLLRRLPLGIVQNPRIPSA